MFNLNGKFQTIQPEQVRQSWKPNMLSNSRCCLVKDGTHVVADSRRALKQLGALCEKESETWGFLRGAQVCL